MRDKRFTREEIVRLALSAVHKINRDGIRGATLCSVDEIVAMALMLAKPELQSIVIQSDPDAPRKED